MRTLLIVDHQDSFTHNLAQAFLGLGWRARVCPSGPGILAECQRLSPRALVLSPGPGHPADWPHTRELIAALPPQLPVLGVCLGHQCLAAAFGGQVAPARAPLHGVATPIWHDGGGLCAGLPNPFLAGRYHSLVVADAPAPFVATAFDAPWDAHPPGALMAMAHPGRPWFGVQFHPESYLTPEGPRLLGNFLRLAGGLARAGATPQAVIGAA